MMNKKYITIAIATLLMTGCKYLNPSKQIRDAFEDINVGLEKSDSIYRDSLKINYDLIKNDTFSKDIKVKADTIYRLNNELDQYIIGLQSKLGSMDTTLNGIEASNDLFFKQAEGVVLYNKIIILLQHAKNYANTPKEIAEIENRSSLYDADYLETSFKDSPTVAAITILTGLSTDMKQVSIIALRNLIQD